ncbi:MAG: TolC family protein [Acidobacteria bacterium]|nr:TolC family protein [Acidobacteriota bacterium]MDA1233333.1 TolC family protein [Acidobacteriota bacterium]
MKKKSLALLMAALMVTPAWAQFSGFPRTSYWNSIWQAPPTEVEIEPVSRLRDFVVDGTLTLSLQQYIELVLANHGDVQVAKLNVYSQENQVQAALSPFDPSFTASFDTTRGQTPSQDNLQGGDIVSSLNQVGRAQFGKTFDTGTDLNANFSTSRNSNNRSIATFNPSLRETFGVNLSQPLLRGRGRSIQRIPYLVARVQLDRSREQARQQIIALLARAEIQYWLAVQQRESLEVQRNNLNLAQTSLERSRRELELGAISPLDIYQPEQQAANAQVSVTNAIYALQQADAAVRRQVGADLDADFRDMPLHLTESANPPEDALVLNEDELIALAFQMRPELTVQRRQLDVRDLNIKQATNQMRPDLSLNASYSVQGLGGNSLLRDGPEGPVIGVLPGGLGDAFGQIGGLDFPTYSVGLSLNLPLRNRAAAATLANQSIAKKQDLYDLRSTEQDIRLNVVQAIAQVEQAKAGVTQALEARRFSQLRLDAEQQRYDLGVSTIFFLLQAQDALIQSQSQVVNQSINYRRAVTGLHQATGDLLNQRNVQIQYD